MSDDLRLNSLDRFTKASDRLTLEVHSHCEIPAGCGGVILRWVNPDDGIPLVFVGGFIADAQVFLDGNEVIGNRVRLQPGEHLLAIDLTNFSTASVASLFAWRTTKLPKR